MHTSTSPQVIFGARATTPRLPRIAPRLAAIATLALLMGGCASQYKFGVDAVQQADDSTPQQSYRLVDARPGAQPNDPEFAHVARDVQTALSSKGLYAAPEGTTAQLVIEVDFGMTGPIVKTKVRSEPVYLELPQTSAGRMRPTDGQMGAGVAPRYMGTRDVPYTFVTYQKFLRLTAHVNEPAPDAPAARQVWSVHVTNNDTSNRLTKYTRLMVAAAMDSISTNAADTKSVVLTRRDCRVEFVSKGVEST